MSFFAAVFTKKQFREYKIARKKSDLECAKLHRKKAISGVQKRKNIRKSIAKKNKII